MRLTIPKMYKLFIGGKFTRTESERYTGIKSLNSGELICNVSRASRKDVRNAVTAARTGYNDWSGKSGYEKAQILYRLAEMLEERHDQFSDSIMISSGCTSAASKKEVSRSVDRIVFYAGLADKWQQFSGSVNPVQTGYFDFSVSEPTGIAGIILPESPSFLPLISRICVTAVTGNSSVVISSEVMPLPALTFAEVIATSDFPAGSVNILTGIKKEIVPHLSGHFDVNALDFCDEDDVLATESEKLCANNVKRFYRLRNHDWNSLQQNENIYEPGKFTEVKTVWHTMGL